LLATEITEDAEKLGDEFTKAISEKAGIKTMPDSGEKSSEQSISP
jgi:hypothetical protein